MNAKFLFKALLLGLLVYMIYKAYRLYKAGSSAVDTFTTVAMAPFTLPFALYNVGRGIATGQSGTGSIFSSAWTNIKSFFTGS
jgi:hypothetical protein